MKAGAVVMQLNKYPGSYEVGQAPIHRAAEKGHTSTVELLISKNADVNVQDE